MVSPLHAPFLQRTGYGTNEGQRSDAHDRPRGVPGWRQVYLFGRQLVLARDLKLTPELVEVKIPHLICRAGFAFEPGFEPTLLFFLIDRQVVQLAVRSRLIVLAIGVPSAHLGSRRQSPGSH